MGCFADDPTEYFGNRSFVAHHLDPEEQEALQLEALQQRFGAMRDTIAPLRALADASKIDEIRGIEDVAPLLFPHSLFKSFPQHLVEELDFAPLTEWLSRLTLEDVSAIAGRSFDTADAWMDAIDEETDLLITHSSGTTGALSLYGRGKREMAQAIAGARMALPDWTDPEEPDPDKLDFSVIWLSYAHGRSAVLRGTEFYRQAVAKTPERFIPLMPGALSSDWQLYVLQVENARQRDQLPPEPSDYVQQKIDEAAEAHRLHDDRTRFLLDTLRDGLDGTKVILAAGPLNLHRFASEGLARGMEPGLAPGSIVRTFGGLKGFAEPENMAATIKRFGGVDHMVNSYGMTEIITGHNSCSHGRFHIAPWVIPLVFEPTTGALLPRCGRQRGRIGFVDLCVQSYWSGVVSADYVEISWDACPCGRRTPHVMPDVVRIPPPGEDEHFLGNASAGAIHAALHALNRDIG